jgi:lipoprotein-anchoring transpeptidase ErfK/SrfK
MTTLKLSTVAIASGIVLLVAVPALGQGSARTDSQQHGSEVAKRVIVVSLEDRRLALVEDGQVKKIYAVAVGKDGAAGATQSSRHTLDGPQQTWLRNPRNQ